MFLVGIINETLLAAVANIKASLKKSEKSPTGSSTGLSGANYLSFASWRGLVFEEFKIKVDLIILSERLKVGSLVAAQVPPMPFEKNTGIVLQERVEVSRSLMRGHLILCESRR